MCPNVSAYCDFWSKKSSLPMRTSPSGTAFQCRPDQAGANPLDLGTLRPAARKVIFCVRKAMRRPYEHHFMLLPEHVLQHALAHHDGVVDCDGRLHHRNV